MYVIMRKLKGYTHFDFLRDDFFAAQYFLLIELINKEVKEQETAMNKKGKR